MKVISPLARRRGRLEIIPLIDIMFFLLAAFMMVSISKIHVHSLKVTLPTNIPTAQLEKKEDFISVSVDSNGKIQLDKEAITSKDQLLARLQALYAQNQEQKFLISADRDARQGDVIGILGALRSAGFQRVAFSISTAPVTDGATAPSAPNVPPPAVPTASASAALPSQATANPATAAAQAPANDAAPAAQPQTPLVAPSAPASTPVTPAPTTQP